MKSLTTEQFIEKATGVHGCLFDYSMVEYKNNRTKVKILCKKHGVFETTPYRHISGVSCPGCVGPNYRALVENAEKTRISKNIFLERSRSKHGERYDYSLVKYKNNHTKVAIVCPVHGSFLQNPGNHMRGSGCQKCYLEKAQAHLVESARKRSKETKRGYVSRVKKIHGNKYDYSEVEYTTWDGAIKIICPVHGPFLQSANNHKQGAGCPQCAPSGFDETIPAILYYLEIETGPGTDPVYKIGVTNRTVWQRYPLTRDREKIKVLKTWEYPLGIDARKTETKIRRMHKEMAYQGEPPLANVGTSEMFSEDVLALANQGEK